MTTTVVPPPHTRPKGDGVTLEHWGLAEAAIRASLGDLVDKASVEKQMRDMFGTRPFQNLDGTKGSHTTRDPRAAGWATPGSGEPIALDNGYNSRNSTHVFSHEGAHAFLGLVDHHKLDRWGYGSNGIQDALKNGLEWNNADSFARVIQGC